MQPYLEDEIKELAPILAIDFDGTITKEPAFPHCAEIADDCEMVLKELSKMGCILILWTCRTDVALQNALEFINKYELPLEYVNEHCIEVVRATSGNESRKIYADYYIDDKNIGGFIGWKKVLEIVKKHPYFISRQGIAG